MLWKPLHLVPAGTKFDFLGKRRFALIASTAVNIISLLAVFFIGLNFGIDFKGGTTIRTEAVQPVDVGAYRAALQPLNLGDVAITEVFDPSFATDQHVAMLRIQAQEGAQSVPPETIAAVEQALKGVDSSVSFTSIESVGPKVSGELIRTAFMAVGASLLLIWALDWLLLSRLPKQRLANG